MEKQRNRLVVLAGPTAVGKGTVEKKLFEAHPDIWLSISATTRDPRPGEVDGVNYFFKTEQEFLDMEARGEFLETATVHGTHHYGTPVAPVLEHLEAGDPSMLEIDVQGVHKVRARAQELGLNPVFVFLAPPSFEELESRLKGRGTETEEQQQRRLQTARHELELEGEFDVVIVNDQVERAAQELWRVFEDAMGDGE
ncbi:guanylate kinase [Alloscardovia theropitheci]|uniref:Guanylate kinase n=1 Tax=Alloscardovia theropitheci TaxID=2496842 RepID=A0A4R0QTP8_9BIFI|nr:guanylate kinase [Alloscardovia theropitheci]TCD54918.1 guanylate kinase [Alloscardovia theropitheci]